jgi:predicted lipoprotein with Yx(FWY)xxD motif
MRIHGRLGYVVIVLVAAVTSVSACGSPSGSAAFTPVAATARPKATQGLGAAKAAPRPVPTVAKTQKWVKIFSGPSAKNLAPPKSIRAGSHDVELNATLSTQFGTYVSDGAGRTLYRFDNDSAKPPKSTCNGACAKTWPPLLIKSPGKIFPKGIDPKILGYVERADGHCQVTINGWPVYYFSGDQAPSEFRGQGLGGVWFAITPTGGKTRNILDGN